MATPSISNFINGKHLTLAGLRRFEKHDPATGQLITLVDEADLQVVDMAVDAAAAAARGAWRKLSPEARAAWLYRIAEAIRSRFDAFVDAEVRDTGKPVTMVRETEMPRVIATFEIFAELIKTTRNDVIMTDLPGERRAINMTTRMPHGVVAVICPWNLPLVLAVWKIAPALACGNTLVVKPSEESPSSVALLAQTLSEIGFPAGVFNVVHGFGRDSAGAGLAANPGVNALTFTGETRTGEAIMSAAAQGVRPVSLELGGKNPAIVFAGADIDAAIDGTAKSAFLNSGQICFGTERIYVERPAFARFVEGLTACAGALRLGDPFEAATTMGPLISLRHREQVLKACESALKDGATVHCGGSVPDVGTRLAGGAWMAPTIWSGLDESADVVRHEVFGPCCHVAPFDTEEEALAMANNSEYGLAAALWTRDHSQAMRVSTQLDVGVVWVNTWAVRDLRTPFGGIGRSGIGREGGLASLDFYSQQRNICSLV
ncbi:2-hydroxymuconic semialdehyde dehydrogenase [Burkholderia sp. OK233]|nr:2-hydroxymuconic semialdehyde dehydrogenase [Burkholderia sp. OK233]